MANQPNEQELATQLEIDRNRRALENSQNKEEVEGEPKKKMSFEFFLVVLLLSAAIDIVEILTGGTLGWFVGIIGDAILVFVFWITNNYQDQKGKLIGALVVETIPFIDFLPIRSFVIIWAFISSHSKIAQKVAEKIEKVTPLGKKVSK